MSLCGSNSNKKCYNLFMNNHIDCPVVILAGGKSSRMGSDKSLLPFDGYKTLIEYQYNKFQKIFKKVYISFKQEDLEVTTKEDKFSFLKDRSLLIEDDNCIYSPMVALQTILKGFKKNSYVFIVAVDIPFLTLQTIQKLYSNTLQKQYQVILPIDKNNNTHNLCGFYNTNVLEEIDKLLLTDIHKIRILIQTLDSSIIKFDTTEEFLNLNDQKSYKIACDSLKFTK